MPHEIIPQQLAIRSMRSSGYRDTAHAIAELIDNSIQAGEGVNPITEVEVLCVDRYRTVSTRRRKQLTEIAVYDNARGMDPKTLRDALQFGNGTRLTRDKQKGIGKFGMGLPNASISQCSKVEVWSWQGGKCFYTYLDVAQIEKDALKVLWPQILRTKEARKASRYTPPPGSAEAAGTKAVTERRAQHGDKGASDKAEKLPAAEREKELLTELVNEGVPEVEAKQIAVDYVKSNVKFLFQEAEVPGTAMFDVRLKAGKIIILINSKHPAREHFFELLKEEGSETDTPAQKALKLLLSAWARLEDESAGTGRKQVLEDARSDWGRLARDFLQAANE